MKKGIFYAGIIFALATRPSTSLLYAQENALPRSMASMGDSITAGALAHYKRTYAMNPLFDLVILTQLAATFLTGNLRFMEARGYSWSIGTSPDYQMVSHAHRLNYMMGGRLKTFNAAVSGNESADLFDQFESIKEWSHTKNRGQFPDYVTILIGANDVCAATADEMVTPDIYEQNVRDVVNLIHKENPNSKVLISALPDIESLRRTAKDAKLVGWGRFAKCENLWSRAQLCNTLTLIEDPFERARVGLRIKEFNAILRKLKTVVDLGEDEELSLARNPNVQVAEKIYDTPFTSDLLSVDCFHPNFDGQNLISELNWKSSWWYKDWQKNYAKRFERHVRLEKARRRNPPRTGKGF
jgi:lysophospholipase L1-like esterase